jgi:pyruvate dehydrogenase E1 component, alpha subunit
VPIVARFEIPYTCFIDPSGRPTQALPPFAQDASELVQMYRMMVLTRSFDTKAIALQRTGQLGTYASTLGQEAIGVGLGCAMQPEDVLLPTYREYGAQLLRGVSMTELLLYWGGDERGNDFQGPRQDFPICVPVATHACHAVGVAYAIKLRRQPRVAVCVLGDGATSKGDFYEAINAAGVWSLPVVFVVSNNQWAISVPRRVQSIAATLAQKAIAAGFSGEQVDGNDIVAVRFATQQALRKARAGGGPSLIEALSYRLSDHTTADAADRYRDEAEVKQAWTRDPIARLHDYLVAQGIWSERKEEELFAECAGKVEACVKEYLSIAPAPAAHMFDYLYATLPAALAEQQRMVGVEDGENA